MSKGINNKREFILEGLDCAHCAAKIEENVSRIDGVACASMNFVTKKLTLEVINSYDLDEIKEKTSKVINQIESGISVLDHSYESNDNEHSLELDKQKLIRLCIGAVLFFSALLFQFSDRVEFILYLVSYLLVSGDVLSQAFKNIVRGQVFDENFLMGIASIGAFAIKEFPEGVAVMLFYQIGEMFQDIAVNRSRKSISALMDIRPDFANLKVGEDIRKVSPFEVNAGDFILVKPGEKVPLDGIVAEGKSMLDTSALTGESVPRGVEPGNEILSGSINQNGLLTVKVTKAFGESTVSKILDLVQNASSKKAPTENFITKFARYYTPFVVLSATALAFIPPLIIPGATFAEWINRALVFLVVSCPCALVVSIPLGFFGGIGGASSNGILIKGSNYLEALNNVDTVIFDKTGTLTKGVFQVTGIKSIDPVTENELLEYAAYAESYSNHPIALSILKEYKMKFIENEIDKAVITDYEEISGHGIKVNVKGNLILAGNSKLMVKENLPFEIVQTTGTVVYIAINGVYAGHIIISDEVKEDSRKAIQNLKSIGVKKVVMLTGDRKAVGDEIGKDLGLDEVYSELLPEQKVEMLEKIEMEKTTKGKLIFVGDGINDAPVLARADIGIAMGGVGSDAAIEAADVVLMTDEPSKIISALKIAKRTRNIVWQNITFAMAIKVFVLIMGAGGIATMWEAVFADVGVAVLAILNAMRVMRSKIE